MTYESWLKEYNTKISEIIGRVNLDTPTKISEYFKYENMVEKETSFCILYKDKIKCHDVEDLNCYFCACPHFRINPNPKTVSKTTIASVCTIDSKYKDIFYENPDENNVVKIHCDCSNCFIPHKTTYVKKALDKRLLENELIEDCGSLIDYIRLKQLNIIPEKVAHNE